MMMLMLKIEKKYCILRSIPVNLSLYKKLNHDPPQAYFHIYIQIQLHRHSHKYTFPW